MATVNKTDIKADELKLPDPFEPINYERRSQ
jgi:hypothetical protein